MIISLIFKYQNNIETLIFTIKLQLSGINIRFDRSIVTIGQSAFENRDLSSFRSLHSFHIERSSR